MTRWTERDIAKWLPELNSNQVNLVENWLREEYELGYQRGSNQVLVNDMAKKELDAMAGMVEQEKPA